jgi:hypothetical protein
MLRPIMLALLLATSGCTLLDQRSFERTPQAPPADAAARAALPAHALLTIRPADGEDWRPALREAVAAAQGRKPDVAFEVAAPVPLGATPARQDRAVRQGAADTTEIANGLLALGVDPGRVHLALHGDAGDPPREVRLYVR